MAESRDDGVVFVPEIFVVIELEANVPKRTGSVEAQCRGCSPGRWPRTTPGSWQSSRRPFGPPAADPGTAKAAMSTGSKRVPPGYLVPAPRPATIAAGTSHFAPLRRRTGSAAQEHRQAGKLHQDTVGGNPARMVADLP